MKHLSNSWRTLDLPLIDCEVSLTLTWSKNCILTTQTEWWRDANPDAYPPVEARERIDAPTNARFKVTDTKLYAPVFTLSTEDDNKLLEQLKSGFKRTIKWNKYRVEMINQVKTNNLNYLIDPTFNKVNILFLSSFQNEEDTASFSKYHTPKVEIKDLDVLINGKSFFDVPVKNKEEAYEKIIEINKNNDYTTYNLLDYECISKHYKLVTINLNKQIELENSDLKQKTNFIGKLEDDRATTMISSLKNQKKTTFEFSQNSVNII